MKFIEIAIKVNKINKYSLLKFSNKLLDLSTLIKGVSNFSEKRELVE